jgi:hypothetical protein
MHDIGHPLMYCRITGREAALQLAAGDCCSLQGEIRGRRWRASRPAAEVLTAAAVLDARLLFSWLPAHVRMRMNCSGENDLNEGSRARAAGEGGDCSSIYFWVALEHCLKGPH